MKNGCTWLCLLTLFLLSCRAGAEWQRSESGACRKLWTVRSLWAGPAAMLDAPLLPLRFVAGAIAEAAECATCRTGKKIGLGAAGSAIGLGFGTFAAFFDATMGLTDLLTGGYYAFTPRDSTRLTLHPIRFVRVGDSCCFFERPEAREGPCGPDRFQPKYSPTWF